MRWVAPGAVGCLGTLAVLSTGASAAPKTHHGTASSLHGCAIVAHPTASNHTDCPSAVLTGAQLAGLNLSYANLSKANLTRADLAGAMLTGAQLDMAKLSGADVSGVVWSGATCPDGINSDDLGGTCDGHLSAVQLALPPNLPAGPATTSAASSLASTGMQVIPLVVTGACLIGLGLSLVEISRRLHRRALVSR